MAFSRAERLNALPAYLFGEIARRKREALDAGKDVIDFGNEPGAVIFHDPQCCRAMFTSSQSILFTFKFRDSFIEKSEIRAKLVVKLRMLSFLFFNICDFFLNAFSSS